LHRLLALGQACWDQIFTLFYPSQSSLLGSYISVLKKNWCDLKVGFPRKSFFTFDSDEFYPNFVEIAIFRNCDFDIEIKISISISIVYFRGTWIPTKFQS
jgi:hypothetical protein